MTVRGRFAPSPSGRMHLGNAFAALLAWLSARAVGGEMVLRIEDLDRARCRPEYAEQLVDDLRWLGLDWDEGGATPQYMQSCRDAVYHDALQKIGEQARVYPCFCTRAELHSGSAPHASDGTPHYDGRCRNLSAAEVTRRSLLRQPALRVEVPNQDVYFEDGLQGGLCENLARDCGDFVLRRSDGGYAYQLAVVADDAAMGITEVVRGGDLLSSTARQIWLHRLLGAAPPRFVHTPLLTAPDGRRLSKRDGDLSFATLRERYTSQQLVGLLAHYAGLADAPTAVDPRRLPAQFLWKNVELARTKSVPI